MQKVSASGKFRHRRKHSVEIEAEVLQEAFDYNAATPVKEADSHPAQDAAVSTPNSLQNSDCSQVELNMREQWAATCIQTAFRGYLVVNYDIRFYTCLLAAPVAFTLCFNLNLIG